MAITNFSVKYRPLKIGFLVEEGSVESLVRAAKLNMLLWGGIHNPIIPVSNESDIEEQINAIQLSSVDVLYPVSDTENIKQIIKRLHFLMAPDNFSNELFREQSFRNKKNSVVYLDSFNIIEFHYEQNFKGTPPDKKSRCILVEWDKSDNLSNLFHVLFGCYEKSFDLNDDFENAFVKGLRSNKATIESGKIVDVKIANKITPAILTSLELRSDSLSGSGGIYIGNPNDFNDLLNFWNLRINHSRLEFLSIGDVGRFKHYIQRYIKNLEKEPGYDFGSGFGIKTIPLYYIDKEEHLVDDVISLFLFKNGFTKVKLVPEQFKKVISSLPTDYLSWEITPGTIENEDGKFQIILNLPQKKFIVDSNRDARRQSLAISIDAMGEFGYDGHILNPPNIKKLNEFYSREITFGPWDIRVEKDGIALIIDSDDKYKTLFPIEQALLIKQIFEVVGIRAEISQPGLLADRVLQQLGGSLEDGRVFKIEGVRKLFSSFRPTDSLTKGEATKVIWQDGEFQKHKSLYIETRESPDLNADSTFNFLLKKGLFRAGLEFSCDHCRLNNWLSLKQIDDYWICEYCGHKNITSLHIRDRGDWKFRRSGLFAKDNNQEGSIPVILTLLTFKRILHERLVFSMSLKLLFDSLNLEIDFSILEYSHGKTNMVIGECKSACGTITQKHADDMKLVRDKLVMSNIECYIVFSKTSDSFGDEEIKIFRGLEKEGIKLILLTSKELDPYHPYWEDDDKEQLPVKHPISLDDMAQNSRFRYLID